MRYTQHNQSNAGKKHPKRDPNSEQPTIAVGPQANWPIVFPLRRIGGCRCYDCCFSSGSISLSLSLSVCLSLSLSLSLYESSQRSSDGTTLSFTLHVQTSLALHGHFGEWDRPRWLSARLFLFILVFSGVTARGLFG